jgi:isopentenyl diphosphate isomerase/L-lactate dehydrogenase-like FMN-dependent dehydrogenase
MFGLAAAGQAGVARVLEIFRTEIEQTMGLVGCPTVADIGRDIVEVMTPPPRSLGERAADGAAVGG